MQKLSKQEECKKATFLNSNPEREEKKREGDGS
jgi:hypothetical protein